MRGERYNFIGDKKYFVEKRRMKEIYFLAR